MYSEESDTRAKKRAVLEKEQEDLAMRLGDTRKRVKKYDRLKKKIKTKVSARGSEGGEVVTVCACISRV